MFVCECQWGKVVGSTLVERGSSVIHIIHILILTLDPNPKPKLKQKNKKTKTKSLFVHETSVEPMRLVFGRG